MLVVVVLSRAPRPGDGCAPETSGTAAIASHGESIVS
jgi:hypothetical protein